MKTKEISVLDLAIKVAADIDVDLDKAVTLVVAAMQGLRDYGEDVEIPIEEE